MQRKTFRYYLLLIFFILIFPLTLFFAYFKLMPTKHVFKTEPYKVPTRAEQPKDTQVVEGVLPIHRWEGPNKEDVYFVPTEKLPMVDVYVTFSAGSARDGDLPGLAELTAYLLEEGTEKYTAEQIAAGFEDRGAQFSIDVARDRVTLMLRSLADPQTLEPVIDLLANILAKPTFSEKSIEQIKNQTLVELKSSLIDPSMIASKALYKAMYPHHPYGHLTSGTLESVAKISRNDIVSFHKEYYVSKNVIVTIVGGISRDQARDISQRLLEPLESGSAPNPIPTITELSKPIEDRIDFASKQSHILLGAPMTVTNNDDYFALQLGNYILGKGPLVARLFKEVRDKKGLAYSVGSVVNRYLQGASFILFLQTKNDQALLALEESQKILNSFIKDGPTQEEVDWAKQGIIAAFPLMIASNADIADIVSTITFYKLPLDYLNQFTQKIQDLTPSTVHAVFKKYLHADKMAMIIVGGNETPSEIKEENTEVMSKKNRGVNSEKSIAVSSENPSDMNNEDNGEKLNEKISSEETSQHTH